MDEYESPIKLIMDRMAAEIAERTDQNIWHAVQRVGFDVDKDELIRALKYDRGQYEKGYNDGYEDGLNADKWISVNDRLPEEEKLYLVFREEQPRMMVLEYNTEKKEFGWTDYPTCRWNMREGVTHWMPLPSTEGLNET